MQNPPFLFENQALGQASLFSFSFQFFTRLATVFADEGGGF